MTLLLAIACVLSLVLAALGIGLAVVAGADPEGRGGNYIFAGLVGSLAALAVAIVCGTWALVRVFT